MPSELPVLRRCCFCFPLRPGLIAWGYFKLAVACFVLLYSLFGIHQVVSLYIIHKLKTLTKYIIILVVLLLLAIIDVTLHVIFVIGGHKKHIHFLKIYNYYSIGLLVLAFLVGLISAGITIKSMIEEYTEHLLLLLISDFSSLVFNLSLLYLTTVKLSGSLINFGSLFMHVALVIQGYVIILVRSEIVKLQNSNSFRFVNNAADAECTLNIEDMNVQSERKEKFIQNED